MKRLQFILPFFTSVLFFMAILFLGIIVFPDLTAGITANLPWPFSDIVLPLFFQPEIKDYELAAHVRFLASDRLAGRLTGTSGISLAEEYISSVYRRAGLSCMPGSDSYFQSFDIYRKGFDAKRTVIEISIGTEVFPLTMYEDTGPLFLSGEGESEAGIVFAGYGITAPEAGWDDYKDIDVKDKIVIILRGEPNAPGTVFAGDGYTKHSQFLSKMRNAKLHGALAVIFVMFDVPEMPSETQLLQPDFHYYLEPEKPDSQSEKPKPDSEMPPPCFIITNLSAQTLFERLGYSLPEIRNAMDTGISPVKTDISALSASLSAYDMQEAETITCRNVVGFLPGTDPALAEEWILVTAHHDHLGTLSVKYSGSNTSVPDTIYNGADDNASGVSGLLELVEAFASESADASATMPPARRRSFLFVTFSAEEEGLFGSEAFVRDHADIIPKIHLVVNLDMIGRNEGDALGIVTRKPGKLAEIINETSKQTGFAITQKEAKNNYYSDDHTFYRKNLETIFFFSGLHPDYHTPDDEAERLDFKVMKDRVIFIFEVIKKIAAR